jgi:hypothetical protein
MSADFVVHIVLWLLGFIFFLRIVNDSIEVIKAEYIEYGTKRGRVYLSRNVTNWCQISAIFQ